MGTFLGPKIENPYRKRLEGFLEVPSGNRRWGWGPDDLLHNSDEIMLWRGFGGTDGCTPPTQLCQIISPPGLGGHIGWQSANIVTDRSDGGNGCCLPYHLSFNPHVSGGSADIAVRNNPSKPYMAAAGRLIGRS